MPILYLSYINLTPGLQNRFSDSTHKAVIEVLRKNFETWTGFFDKYIDWNLGYIVTTKKGIEELEVKGPTIFKRDKLVDYTIFLPDVNYSLGEYIDFVFKGIAVSLKEYEVEESAVILMREKCKKDLNFKV